MNLAGWVRTSTVDFPGRLATVVFTAGCDLDCFFCHNRLLIDDDRSSLAIPDVLRHLEKRQGILDGVVISGGEPTLQPDLVPFIRQVSDLGYAVKLDTNGAHPDVLASLLSSNKRLVDYVAIDYKAPWHRYPDICGCGPETADAVQESFFMLRRHMKESEPGTFSWEARTTVIPQLSEQELVSMAMSLPILPLYALQMYRPPEMCKPEDRFRINAAAMTAGMLKEVAEKIRPHQPNVTVRA